MLLQELQMELSVESNDNIDRLAFYYCELLKVKERKVNWNEVNDKIINKYGYDFLDEVKHKAWKIFEYKDD